MLDTLTKERPSVAAINQTQNARELSWVSERIQRGRAGVFCEVATITPAIAKRLLEANGENRALKTRWVSEIADDIKAGRWDMNGEAIKVSKTGELNDGQHRLNAVVEAGKPIQSLIIFGLPRDSRFTVDMGHVRSVGDFLGMEGAVHRNNAAAVAKLHNLYRRGYYGDNGRINSSPTKQEIRGEFWRFEKQISRALDSVCTDQFCRRHGVTPLATAHVVIFSKNKEAGEMFFQRLKDGANLKQGDAILALRARLTAVRTERYRPHEKLELILRYWNAWRKGMKITRALRLEGSYPKVEG